MLPVYAVWMLICYCAPGHFHDPATAVSIILLALMMLFIVFIPKLYTINQQMKLEDSKDIFYSQQTSLNDSTLQSGSHSYGHHGPGGRGLSSSLILTRRWLLCFLLELKLCSCIK